MIQPALFYFLSAMVIFSALVVVTQRSLFTCALYLALSLSMVAGLFVLLGADFLAALQILLYVGGVIVIMAFAVMLSSAEQTKTLPQLNEQWLPSLLGAGAILALLLVGIKKNPFTVQPGVPEATTAAIGHLLLRDMSLPFEAVSLILTAALVGAILFSKKNPAAREKKDA